MHRPPARSLGPLGVLLRARGAMVAVVGLVSAAAVLLAAVLSAAVDPASPARLADSRPAAESIAQADSPTPAPGAVTLPTPVVTYDVFLARDPFEPVVPEPEPDPVAPDPAAPADPTAPGSPSGPTSPTAPSSPSSPSSPSDPSAPACTGGNEVVCNGRVVTLLDVVSRDGERVAVVQVDTSIFEVRIGEVFATHFELRSIDGRCAGVLYGDDGFRLCAGDTVLK